MKQKKKIIINTIIIPLITGLFVNFFYDKLKNHQSIASRKSGFKIELNLNIENLNYKFN